MGMMGRAVGRQDRFFYAFRLEDRIPADHLLRRIDAVLDLSWLRGALNIVKRCALIHTQNFIIISLRHYSVPRIAFTAS